MVQENRLNKVVVICGPTASGKTSLAVECARLLNSEVVSADSMTIYRGLDIGTAKPSKEERKGVIHHMIDVADPHDAYSVGDYRDEAMPIVRGIIQRGKIPVICGGTGFYINSLLFDMSYGSAPANSELREKYETLLAREGKEKLHSELQLKDPETAAILHVNDVRRVMRALEIFDATGKKKSDLNDGHTPLFDYHSFCVDYPRQELYERINVRVDEMVANGLFDEVRGLLDRGVDTFCQCMQGIGYKEVATGLSRGDSAADIAEEIKLNTRRYAKRQITFFKRDARLEYLTPDTPEKLAKYIVDKIG